MGAVKHTSAATSSYGRRRARGAPRLLAIALLFAALGARASEFRSDQLRHERVRRAVESKTIGLKALFEGQRLAWPPAGVFVRAFKREGVVELWGKRRDGAYGLVKQYPICASSGSLGPKRREGDLQVPEGFYSIAQFNPTSHYHLALGIDYPNASDRVLGAYRRLGGDIFIHGKCCTIGCIPIQDEKIEELYVAAMEARAAGQRDIPVAIFPARLTSEGMQQLAQEFTDREDLLRFWRNLKEGYDLFERERRPPGTTVGSDGRYRFERGK